MWNILKCNFFLPLSPFGPGNPSNPGVPANPLRPGKPSYPGGPFIENIIVLLYGHIKMHSHHFACLNRLIY